MENSLIVTVLKRKHPIVFDSIVTDLQKVFMNYQVANQKAIRELYLTYCEYKEIDIKTINWHINASLRREMIAMMLLRFNPERIHGLSNKGVKKGLLKELCAITDISQPLYSNDIYVVCDFFKVYVDYRNNVLSTFEKINENIIK